MYDPNYEEVFEICDGNVGGLDVLIRYQTDDHECCYILNPKTEKKSQEYSDLWDRSTDEQREELIVDILDAIAAHERNLDY